MVLRPALVCLTIKCQTRVVNFISITACSEPATQFLLCKMYSVFMDSSCSELTFCNSCILSFAVLPWHSKHHNPEPPRLKGTRLPPSCRPHSSSVWHRIRPVPTSGLSLLPESTAHPRLGPDLGQHAKFF